MGAEYPVPPGAEKVGYFQQAAHRGGKSDVYKYQGTHWTRNTSKAKGLRKLRLDSEWQRLSQDGVTYHTVYGPDASPNKPPVKTATKAATSAALRPASPAIAAAPSANSPPPKPSTAPVEDPSTYGSSVVEVDDDGGSSMAGDSSVAGDSTAGDALNEEDVLDYEEDDMQLDLHDSQLVHSDED